MSGWTPSIVPKGNDHNDHNVCLVLEDFGQNGMAWRETAIEATDFEIIVADLLAGQYQSPVKVVGFNTSEGWSRDISADVARELRQHCHEKMRDIPSFLQDFIDRHEGRYSEIQLPSPLRELIEIGYGDEAVRPL